MPIRLKVIYILLGCLILVGCDKDLVVPQYNGFNNGYLKIRVGTNWIYKVDSVYEETDRASVTDSFYVKEAIVDSMLDGRIMTYIFEKSRSNSLTGPYIKSGDYSLVLSDNRLIYNGDDYSAIVLSTPLIDKNSWTSNYQQSYDPISEILSVNDSEIINGIKYENVVHVMHFLEFQFDYRRNHSSRFAEDVGVIQETFYRGYYNRLAASLTSTTITKSLLTYAY